MASNRRHAGQSSGSGNLSATVAADQAFLALLGICSRTLLVKFARKMRGFRLNRPYPEKPTTFGESFRKHRLDSGLTQPELAQQIGVSKSSIDKWECDWTTPPSRYHSAIEAFLGATPLGRIPAGPVMVVPGSL